MLKDKEDVENSVDIVLSLYFLPNVISPFLYLRVADAGSSATTAAATPQQLMTCGGTVSPPAVSLTPSDSSPGAMSPEDTSFNSDPLGEMVWIIIILLLLLLLLL